MWKIRNKIWDHFIFFQDTKRYNLNSNDLDSNYKGSLDSSRLKGKHVPRPVRDAEGSQGADGGNSGDRPPADNNNGNENSGGGDPPAEDGTGGDSGNDGNEYKSEKKIKTK